ncbi:competence protein ComEC [Neisseria sp. HSC-16F19]|nr:DNA internalization-related competence protein ComEC/Rec2 [Neisseria sp. HSC-16F19]MCP2041845.1 competence protein ComEC [Neisseria sp. HSC-16F19]
MNPHPNRFACALPWLPFWAAGVMLPLALPWGGAGYWLAAAASAALLYGVWRRPWLGWLLALLIGCSYGVWRTESAVARQWPLAAAGERHSMEVRVLSAARQDVRRQRIDAELTAADGRRYRAQLNDYRERDWPAGSRWQAEVRLRPMVGEANAVGFNREAWALANGIHAGGSIGKERVRLPENTQAGDVWRAYRARLQARWQRAAADYPQGAALMQALSLGDQGALAPEAWQAFRPLGINHLVSISGLHIGLVAVLAAGLMRALLRFIPGRRRAPKLWWLGAGVAAAVFYAALSGFAVPAQRALLMTAILAWGWYRREQVSPWQTWWRALAAVLLLDPLAVLGAGFWLSFGLVAALIWAAAGRSRSAVRGWRRGLLTAVRAQWAASLASVVGVAYLFGSVPVLSPLVNAVAIPWFSWVLVPLGLLCLLMPWQAAVNGVAALAEYTMQALLWLGVRAPEIAVAQAPAPLLLLGALGAAVWLLPRGLGWRPLGTLFLLLMLCYRPPALPHGVVRISVWDVGQGLSVLAETRHHRLLYDTGTAYAAASQVLPNLRARGVRRLDALVLSHADADHDGGAALLAAHRLPESVWAGQPEAYAALFEARYCAPGHWQWDGVWFEFLTLPPPAGADDNEHSCIMRVIAGGQALLLTGDVSLRGEQALAAHYDADALYSQVWVLGHHGSHTSNGSTLLNAVRPEWAVASSGFANAYRHPHPWVLQRLAREQVRLHRTDEQGGAWFELGRDAAVEVRPIRDRPPFWQRKPVRKAE